MTLSPATGSLDAREKVQRDLSLLLADASLAGHEVHGPGLTVGAAGRVARRLEDGSVASEGVAKLGEHLPRRRGGERQMMAGRKRRFPRRNAGNRANAAGT